MSASLRAALDACWTALGHDMIGRRYLFVDAPARTFTVLGRTESGKLEILENSQMRRYADAAMLAQCLRYGVVEEIA